MLLLYKEDFPIEVGSKTEAEVLQEIQEQLSTLTIEGTSGWRLPDEAEADAIIKGKGGFNNTVFVLNTSANYYYFDNNKLGIFISTNLLKHLTFDNGTHYRPVITLRFQK